jgi:CRP/FNR family cyclic AMP-dependent transcriptional regulator
VEYRRVEVSFTQGDLSESVPYVQKVMTLSVLSRTGREAVVAMRAPGDFFGEGCWRGNRSGWGVRPRSLVRISFLISREKRLVRTPLLLARYEKQDTPVRAIPNISQETLADMVGTTRSRVNVFMNSFQRLEFIDCKNGLTVTHAPLTVVFTRLDEFLLQNPET